MRRCIITLLCLAAMTAQAQTPRQITDYLRQREKMCRVTPDSIFPTLRRLETMRASAHDSVTWAVLSECLGLMYETNLWTAQHDATGESIEEWSRSQWREAASQRRADARTPILALRHAKARQWTPVIRLVQASTRKASKQQQDTIVGSRWFDDDLLHVLHHMQPTEDVARYYADCVGGNAAVMARLWMIDGTDEETVSEDDGNSTARLDSLLRAAESDDGVSDEVRSLVRVRRVQCESDDDRRVALAEECIARYGHLATVNSVRNLLRSMRSPYLHVQWPDRVYPGRTYRVPVEYRNIQGIRATVGHDTHTFQPRQAEPHTTVHDTLTLTAPSKGSYHVKVSPQVADGTYHASHPDTTTMYVSPLRLLRLSTPQADSTRWIVVDALSGAPVRDARVHTYINKVKRGRYTDERHMVCIMGDPQPAIQYWADRDYNPFYSEHSNYSIHTDRAIYRPGQRVDIGVVVYRQRHWDASASEGESLPMEIRDSHYDIAHTDTLTTDAYGCASTTFTLPAQAKLGRYIIRLGDDYQTFRVEEYKRPTYTISLSDSLRGDIATVTVRALNGTPVRGARITGTSSIRTGWWRGASSEVQDIDTLWTDGDGRADIRLNLPQDTKDDLDRWLELSVNVQSPTGETHDASHVYRVGGNRAPAAVPDTMPRDTIAWFRCLNDTLFADRPARIEVGSAASDVHLMMAVFRGRECIEEREIVFSDSLTILEFRDTLLKYYPECDGVSVSLAFMKDEQVYSHDYALLRPQPDSRLRWTWDTFRDHVTPGNREVWTGRLRTPDGRPADANAMFTIYDASLDSFVPHAWHLGVTRGYGIFRTSYQNMTRRAMHHGYIGVEYSSLRVPSIAYHTFAAPLANALGGVYDNVCYSLCGAAMPMRKTERLAPAMAMARGTGGMNEDGAIEECTVMCDIGTYDEDDTQEAAPGANGAPIPIRGNMQETAYFVPTLRTDSNGRITLRFTLPDAMTTWRVLGVAHTRDMLTADITAETVAQKQLMAMVDVPRLLRQGDEGTAAVTVQNITGKPQQVTLTVDVLDAASETVISTEKRLLRLSTDTVMHFALGTAASDIIVRATAVADGASDGEQRLVPVLDDSEWTARSTDLQCRGVGEHVFVVDSLFEESDIERRVTVQYTESPVWTAIEVLRHLTVPQHDDAISLHTALYAGALTSHLASTHSAVADYLHYDADSARTALDDISRRLTALHCDNGGYSWFPGFSSSEWITAEVATTLVRLREMTGRQRGELGEAIRYLRDCNAERVRWMKKEKAQHVPTIALQYLYILAMSEQKADADARYLLNLLREQSAQPERLGNERAAIAAIVMERMGYQKEAQMLRQRLRDYLVTTDGQGTSFSYLRGSFTSIDRKLLDHIYAMEALSMGDGLGTEGQGSESKVQSPLLTDMRRHLLLQKRVQAWDNPLVNASAVYALLLGSETRLSTDEHDVLRVDNDIVMHITDGRAEERLPVTHPVHTVTVEKHGAQESWGAVYVESRQRLADIHARGTGLAVRRYVEEQEAKAQGANSTRMMSRIVIHADRDYECVHVSVPRPACWEPADGMSRHHWQGGLSYYHEVHDASDELFIERLPKGDYVLTMPAYAVREGRYNAGVVRIECLYAPEFCGNTGNETVTSGPIKNR